jgi:hypothetical protein
MIRVIILLHWTLMVLLQDGTSNKKDNNFNIDKKEVVFIAKVDFEMDNNNMSIGLIKSRWERIQKNDI